MKKREILTPDITPLIDVVFILLIFFIVSSVFKKDELALVLNLPTSSAKEIELKQKEVIIELDKNKLAIYGKEVSISNLEEEISKIKDKKRNIIFRIDKEVKYERVVEILDLLQKHELFNISLLTDTKSK
ncbi:Biopolymer transport protein ExbD/TolR [Arcobacter nitrofigilis DSM 7299]|uniref:Biopolymer transport protein ExbD/TolR n=1 Tax=Arcobacter nitrofigilis (strain ATCC 33309 / DSM 7299 / CCUG 15893 / LMG 7604 / NCTC 12251 / CI) TaxID=572480 RepID=D5V3F5_ARCNC|nr:biopolymer transporter ExbD [Arcobacter nitrofigilis]ADG92737.1 Biopolymer transport protein ExbD/TolR [Arcobacter nitrofigilis DSM 7299]